MFRSLIIVNLIRESSVGRSFTRGYFFRSARPLRSLAEWQSGVPSTFVRLRWRSAELPLERKCPALQKLPLFRSSHSAQLRH
ncbi:hypothetical protein H8E88_02865 [candidate division KSB1 bacterium]|nr:hypothetical protein [candidate division KSB1 bacterium]